MRRVVLYGAAVLVLCLFAVSPAVGETYTKYPTDDVCVRVDSGNTSTQGNGLGPLLYVGGHIVDNYDYWNTYMKFNLSQFAGGTINSATLKMVCDSHSGTSVNVSVYKVISEIGTWDENYFSQDTATQNFTISGSAAATTTVNDTDAVFSWTVTTAARSHLGGDFTLCIKEQNQPSAGKWAKFCSKDHNTTGYWPYLSVNYSPAPGDDDPRGYIDFDPSVGIDNLIIPELYDPFDAYVVVDQMANGMTTCCFALSVTPGMSATTDFEPLLPGMMTIGNWATGITVTSTEGECLGMGGEPVNIGVLHMLYLGVPGDVMLLDHPDYPRWVIDCTFPGLVNYYCVLSHGGVGKDPLPGDCGVTPAQDTSWGAIKAMYR